MRLATLSVFRLLHAVNCLLLTLVTIGPIYAQAAEVDRYQGRVLLPDGNPAVGASVIVFDPQAMLGGTDELITAVKTDRDGRFQFQTPKGRPSFNFKAYTIHVPGFAIVGGNVWPDRDETITLGPPTRVRVTFIGPDGNPVPKLRAAPAFFASLTHELGLGFEVSPALSGIPAQLTDADGSVTFDALPRRGSLRLKISDERFANLSFADNVALADAQTSPPAIVQLRPGSVFTGRITFADSGKPAAAVRVMAQGTNGSMTHSGSFALTDANGVYRLIGLEAGEFNVMPSLSESMERDWTAVAHDSVSIGPGQTIEGLDFKLIKGAVITGQVILEHSGRPVAFAEVGTYGPARPRSGAAVQGTWADAEGKFCLRVPPGKQYLYLMGAAPAGYERESAQKNLSLADGQTTTEDLVLHRRPGLPVSGVVLDPSGNPAADAIVYGYPPQDFSPNPLSAKTDAEGRFHIDGVAEHTLLRARKGKWATAQAVTTQLGQSGLQLQLRDDAIVSLHGKVVDESGKPIPNARVKLGTWYGTHGIGGGVPLLADAGGRYTFKDLYLDLAYDVQADADGYGMASVRADLKPGKDNEAPNLVLPGADSRIAGQLVFPDGSPAAERRIEFVSGTASRYTTSDDAGHFQLRVPSGCKGKLVVPGFDVPLDTREVAAGDEDIRIVIRRRQTPSHN